MQTVSACHSTYRALQAGLRRQLPLLKSLVCFLRTPGRIHGKVMPPSLHPHRIPAFRASELLRLSSSGARGGCRMGLLWRWKPSTV